MTKASVMGLVLVLVGGASAAPDPAFDFTAHWAGYYSEDGGPQQSLAAALTTQSGTRHFTGTLSTATDTCNVTGVQKAHHMKVKAHLACASGSKLNLHATLDATTDTLTGGYRRRGRHKVHIGTFTLVEQPS